MRRAVWAMLVLLLILHQDWWWWNSIDPLVFGFVPIGLAYHAIISVVAAVLWALAVHYCWPDQVETWGEQGTHPSSGPRGTDS